MERSDWSRSKFGKWDLVELEGEQYSVCKTPWPTKCYACSFCKREFRSAQALGGHMNVHRKDRARLKLLSSWVLGSQNPKPNPNPNPNPINTSSSNSLTSHSANFSVYPNHSSLSPHFTTPSSKEKTTTPFPGMMHAHNYGVRRFQDSKQVLDLELRLGHL